MSSYIAQYSIIKRHTLHCLADQFNRKPSRLLWEETMIDARRIFLHKYPLLSAGRYYVIQLGELVQCKVTKP